jgi:hypothetical protein
MTRTGGNLIYQPTLERKEIKDHHHQGGDGRERGGRKGREGRGREEKGEGEKSISNTNVFCLSGERTMEVSISTQTCSSGKFIVTGYFTKLFAGPVEESPGTLTQGAPDFPGGSSRFGIEPKDVLLRPFIVRPPLPPPRCRTWFQSHTLRLPIALRWFFATP